MLIEQTIAFQSKGPGPFGRTCTSITGKLHDKTKISKENLREDYYLLLKYCRRQCALLPYRPNHLQLKFYTIMQDSKRVLEFNCKRKIEQLKFFDWL